MIKHDRYGTAFLVEGLGAGTGMADVDQHVPGRWKVLETIELHKIYEQKFGTYNTPTKLVFAALNRAGITPKVYIVANPNSQSSRANTIKHPSTLHNFAVDVGKATQEGHPPPSFRVLVSGPSAHALQELIEKTHTVWVESREADIPIDKVQKALDGYVKTKLRSATVAAWVEIQLKTVEGTRPSKAVHTKFDFQQIGYNVTGHAGGYMTTAPKAEHNRIVRIDDKNAAKIEHLKLLREAVVGIYFNDLWRAFKTFVYDAPDGVVHTLDGQLMKNEVRAGFDKAKGKVLPVTAKVTEPFQKAPHRQKPKAKVVASIPGIAGDIGTMIVSADPKDRREQKADGTFTKPAPLPQHVGRMVPESSVNPIVDDTDYQAIFGIYYDHPLIAPKANRQIYWYGNRNHYFNAAFHYATMTGDTPHIAYRIFRKKGDRAGIEISRNELNRQAGPAAQRVKQAIDETIRSFHRQIKSGKALFPAKIAKWLGPDVDIGNPDIPENPFKENPADVDPEGWNKYIRFVRRGTKRQLGLNFFAQLEKKYIDPNTSTQKLWRYSRHRDKPVRMLKKNITMTGERDKRGKPKEKWALYLIEYLMAHKTYGAMQETFMVPLNIVRADDDIPPRGSTRRFTKAEYMQLLRENFSRFPVSKQTNWVFLRAQLSAKFPFARLIRHSVMMEKDVDPTNRKLRRAGIRNIERTAFGYKIDRTEWDAYQMVVAMPPSVAEKEFGLIHRNSYSRLILDEPRLVQQLRQGKRGTRKTLKDFGLTPMKLKTEFITSPLAKASQVDIRPTDVVGKLTVLPPGYFASKLGITWKAKIEDHMDATGEVMTRSVESYEKANDPEERMKIWHQYARKVVLKAKEIEHDIRHYIRALAQVRMEKGSALGAELDANIDTYIRYVREELSPRGHSYAIPQVVTRLGLATYEAPFASLGVRTQSLKIKAPSSEVAKLLILYRLLRRSASNKELGRAMNIRSKGGAFRIFPDNNARVLAQWAAANFLVIRQDDPKSIRRIRARRVLSREERQRGIQHGDHRFARMLRID
jgi:hypothetical protein